MKDIDFWFEFASTYSYLAAMRAQDLAADCGVRLTWRPFLLGAIFKKDLGYADSPFNRHAKKGDYMWRDMDRQVRIHGLPSVKKPEPFPQNGLTAARIAMVLEEDDRLPIFVRSVFRAQFQYGETISEPDVLFDILSQNGFDAPDVMQRAKSDKIKQALKTQTEHADRIGIFGAPSFVTPKGELFWGDDRMETAFRWQD